MFKDDSTQEYFAAVDDTRIAAKLQGKQDTFYTYVASSNLVELWRRAYRNYYGMRQVPGAQGWGMFDVGGLIASGDQGEIIRARVPHLTNLGTHLLSLLTANRPALQTIASNGDAQNLIAAQLGNGILDYYFDTKKVEKNYFGTLESGVVMSEGYTELGWDPKGGERFSTAPDGSPIFKGDLTVKTKIPFQVTKDVTKTSDDQQDWYITHGKINRFEAIAQFARGNEGLRQKLLMASSDQMQLTNRTFADPSRQIATTSFGIERTDDIPYSQFYHRPTAALPKGRWTIYVNADTLLDDNPLTPFFPEIPVYRFAPKDIMGTPFGWTPMFDILALSELLDKLYTVTTSNVLGSGLANFWLPPNSGIQVSQIAGQRTLIESIVKPEILELLKTPAEVYSYIDKIEKVMEILTGVSSINRGDLPSADMSGSAMAFIASQAVSFNSTMNANAIEHLKAIGMGIINIFKLRATTQRAITVCGKAKIPMIKSFMGKDLESINSVTVDAANPLLKRTEGRLGIASDLMSKNMLKSPQEYMTVIETGRLETVMDPVVMENFNIQRENDWIMMGKQPMAIRTDNHRQHIAQHNTILATPEARENPTLVQMTLAHIAEHEAQEAWMMQNDPMFLAANNYAPLPLPAPVPTPAGAGQPGQQNIAPMFDNQNPIVEQANETRMPNMPNLPAGSDQQTQESYGQLLQQQGAA